MDKHAQVLSDRYGLKAAPLAPQLFAAAAREHMEKYGMKIFQLLATIPAVVDCLITVKYSQNDDTIHFAGTKADIFAKIAEKNHRHSANNP